MRDFILLSHGDYEFTPTMNLIKLNAQHLPEMKYESQCKDDVHLICSVMLC